MGQSPDGENPQAEPCNAAPARPRALSGAALWQDSAFLTLAAGMALGLFAQIGLIAHLFSLLVPAFGAQGAGAAMGLATACAVAGRSLVGWLMPARADRRLIASASYAVQLTGSLIFIAAAGESLPLLLLGVVLFGAGIGNATSLPPLVAQAEFAKEEVQRVVSQIVAIGQATYAFAPAACGVLISFAPGVLGLPTGDATPLFAAAAIIQLLAICCFLLGRRRGMACVPG